MNLRTWVFGSSRIYGFLLVTFCEQNSEKKLRFAALFTDWDKCTAISSPGPGSAAMDWAWGGRKFSCLLPFFYWMHWPTFAYSAAPVGCSVFWYYFHAASGYVAESDKISRSLLAIFGKKLLRVDIQRFFCSYNNRYSERVMIETIRQCVIFHGGSGMFISFIWNWISICNGQAAFQPGPGVL